jgi:Xanthomonas XOO_2897-like deaminase
VAFLSDSQRAISRGVVGGRGLLRPDKPYMPPSERIEPRDAAVALGRVYHAVDPPARKLGSWALPTYRNAMDERGFNVAFTAALETVLGDDFETPALYRRYDQYFEVAVEPLDKAAQAWALRKLREHVAALTQVRNAVSDPVFSAWANGAAKLILTDSVECRATKAKAALAGQAQRRPTQIFPLPGDTADLLRTIRDHCIREAFVRLAKAEMQSRSTDTKLEDLWLRRKFVDVMRILSAAHAFPDLVEAYARSPAEGRALTLGMVAEAAQAVDDFRGTIEDRPRKLWKYPVALIGALRDLSLADIPDFQDYVLSVAPVIATLSAEDLLSYVGVGLLVVGFVAGGLSVGAAWIDLVTNGFSVYFAYVREHEEELAAKSSLFLPDEAKFATEYGYGGTALATAFMLVSAASLLHAVAVARVAKVTWSPKAPPLKDPAVALEGKSAESWGLRPDVVDLMLNRTDEMAGRQFQDPFARLGTAESNQAFMDRARGISEAVKVNYGGVLAFASAVKRFTLPPRIEYLSDAKSRLAGRLRLLSGLRASGNVAVFEFAELPPGFVRKLRLQGRAVLIDGRLVAFRNFNGGPHSEEYAHLLISEARREGYELVVTSIYSEFSPCIEICLPLLEENYRVAVTWSFPYNFDREDAARDAAFAALFRGRVR